jgi:hypothetical protein
MENRPEINVGVTAAEGQGQTETLGTQLRGRKRCLAIRGRSSEIL